MNRLYPLFVKLDRKPCLVIGGGPVAAQKIQEIIECGGQVTVISPELSQEVKELSGSSSLRHIGRRYQQGDTRGYFLVIAATDDGEANGSVAAECEDTGILCNVVDVPHLCNFYAASVVRQGDLKIAISTNGKSPALAKRIRMQLEKIFGREYAVFLRFLGRLRAPVLKQFSGNFAGRKEFFESVVNSNALDLLSEGERERFLGKMRAWYSEAAHNGR